MVCSIDEARVGSYCTMVKVFVELADGDDGSLMTLSVWPKLVQV